MATKVNLKDIVYGDTVLYEFRFPATTDITNYIIWFTAKVDNDDPDGAAIIQFNTKAGDHPNDDIPNSKMFVELPSTITKVTVGSYVYDFQRVIDGTTPPNVKTLSQGKVKVVLGSTISEA